MVFCFVFNAQGFKKQNLVREQQYDTNNWQYCTSDLDIFSHFTHCIREQ